MSRPLRVWNRWPRWSSPSHDFVELDMNTSERKQHWTRHPLVALAVLLAGGAFFYAKSGLFRAPIQPGQQAASGQTGSGGHNHGAHGGSAAPATAKPPEAETRDIFISPERQQL